MGGAAIRTGWWLYFGLLVLHVATAPWLERLDLAGWASWGLGAMGLLGLWGYLCRRRIGWRALWIACFLALLLGVGHDATVSFLRLASAWSLVWLAGIVLGLAFNFPLLWALWRYAFRSPDIWQSRRPRGRTPQERPPAVVKPLRHRS